MGLITGRAVANATGLPTVFDAVKESLRNPGPVGMANVNSGLLNFLAVGVAWEVGLYAGTMLSVANDRTYWGPSCKRPAGQ